MSTSDNDWHVSETYKILREEPGRLAKLANILLTQRKLSYETSDFCFEFAIKWGFLFSKVYAKNQRGGEFGKTPIPWRRANRVQALRLEIAKCETATAEIAGF